MNAIKVEEGMRIKYLDTHFRYYPGISVEGLDKKYAIGEACSAFVKDAEMYIIPNALEAVNALEREGFQYEAFDVPPLWINPFSTPPEVILIDPLAIKDCQA